MRRLIIDETIEVRVFFTRDRFVKLTCRNLFCRMAARWILRCFCGLALAACIAQADSCDGHSSAQPVEYPSAWPIPELTAPPGSHRAVIRSMPAVDRDAPAYQGHVIDGYCLGQHLEYVVGFTYDGAWEEAVAHVEASLEWFPYREITDHALDTDSDANREYELKEQNMLIQLNRRRYYKENYYNYYLRVMVYQ